MHAEISFSDTINAAISTIGGLFDNITFAVYIYITYLYPQMFEIHFIEYKRNRDKHNNRTSYNKPPNDNNSGSGNNKDNNSR